MKDQHIQPRNFADGLPTKGHLKIGEGGFALVQKVVMVHKYGRGKVSWETDGRKILESLRMFPTGGSGDVIDDVYYMAGETMRQYCKSF